LIVHGSILLEEKEKNILTIYTTLWYIKSTVFSNRGMTLVSRIGNVGSAGMERRKYLLKANHGRGK